MSVYIDTSAFLAILNEQDARHEEASKTWMKLIDDQSSISTSNYVVVETTALLQSRHGVPAVRQFTENLLPVVLVEWIDAPIHAAAMSAVLASSGKQSPSLVDCVSFEIIRRKKIIDVFAYDRHFADRGFSLVRRS